MVRRVVRGSVEERVPTGCDHYSCAAELGRQSRPCGALEKESSRDRDGWMGY